MPTAIKFGILTHVGKEEAYFKGLATSTLRSGALALPISLGFLPTTTTFVLETNKFDIITDLRQVLWSNMPLLLNGPTHFWKHNLRPYCMTKQPNFVR